MAARRTFRLLALLRDQATQTLIGQGALCFAEGWPRDPEDAGHIADGHAVGFMATHHLIAHLDKALGVEEGIADEQDVADGFGVGSLSVPSRARASRLQADIWCIIARCHLLRIARLY